MSKALTTPESDSFPRKRKRIDDFFTPNPKESRLSPSSHSEKASSSTAGLARIASGQSITSLRTSIPGLEILENFISAEEEESILGFLYSSKCKWRTDLARRCMHFGGTYCLYTPRTTKADIDRSLSKPEIYQAPSMPKELDWLIERFVSSGVFVANTIPRYCIVNEYVSSQGISPHVENFQFGEPVVGLSLLSPVTMRFHEMVKPNGGSVRSGKAALAEKTGRKIDVTLRGRSLCVMRGESRWKWQHEIPRCEKGRGVGWKRVSLTFRWKEAP
jgi:alkylated DNA repair protein alkB family protein 8